MRLFYIRERRYVAAYFTGTGNPLEHLVEKLGLSLDGIGAVAGPIYGLRPRQGSNRCDIQISRARDGIVLVTGFSKNEGFLSAHIRRMLIEIYANDLPIEKQQRDFEGYSSVLRDSLRTYAEYDSRAAN